MGFKCGIVGLPNVGKSTLFNAMLGKSVAEAANYPFCTIDPNIGTVAVTDKRLTQLAQVEGSKKIIPTNIEFVDIAGLVKGAHDGSGLGNKFLGHIREVDAIAYVLRCFDHDDVIHVDGFVDPIRDAEVIKMEMIFADIESLEKRIKGMDKKSKQNKEIFKQLDLMEQILTIIKSDGDPRSIINEENKKDVKMLNLLTTKPYFYICNVAENELNYDNDYVNQVFDKYGRNNCIKISAQIEYEIATLEDEEEKQEFLREISMNESGLSQIINKGYDILDLQTFFTVGPQETRAWTMKNNTLAPQAAGLIHSDFENKFICAEITPSIDYLKLGGFSKSKESGKTRTEGKDYIMQDGDIALFKFNKC